VRKRRFPLDFAEGRSGGCGPAFFRLNPVASVAFFGVASDRTWMDEPVLPVRQNQHENIGSDFADALQIGGKPRTGTGRAQRRIGGFFRSLREGTFEPSNLTRSHSNEPPSAMAFCRKRASLQTVLEQQKFERLGVHGLFP